MGWVKVKDRNPTKKGYYRVMVDGFPGNDFEDKTLNLFDGTDWDYMESCRQHINEWWEDYPLRKVYLIQSIEHQEYYDGERFNKLENKFPKYYENEDAALIDLFPLIHNGLLTFNIIIVSAYIK